MRYILEGSTVKKVENPCEWALWILENNKVIDYTLINNIKIKTIFLGMDMGSENDLQPLVFKSFINGPGFILDCYSEYYTTFDEAIEGHKKLAEKIKLCL